MSSDAHGQSDAIKNKLDTQNSVREKAAALVRTSSALLFVAPFINRFPFGGAFATLLDIYGHDSCFVLFWPPIPCSSSRSAHKLGRITRSNRSILLWLMTANHYSLEMSRHYPRFARTMPKAITNRSRIAYTIRLLGNNKSGHFFLLNDR